MDKYLEQAIKIADRIIEKSVATDDWMIWDSGNFDKSGNKVRNTPSHTLYKGGAGIALFFIELYNITGVHRYLEVAKKAYQGCLALCSHSTHSASLFLGDLGVSWLGLQLFLTTGEIVYLDRACQIARECSTYQSPDSRSELLYGYAGTILGLIGCWTVSGSEFFHDAIAKTFLLLQNNLRPEKTGISWDKPRNSIHPLCGASHGASGVALALIQLLAISGHEFFAKLADLSFQYEDQWWNSSNSNWADLRMPLNDPSLHRSLIRSYVAGETQVFLKPLMNSNAWCHGAAGIAATRLYAQKLGVDSKHIIEALNCCIARSTSHEEFYTLCHGLSGIGDFLITASTQLGSVRAWDGAIRIGDQILDYGASNQEYKSGYKFAFPEDMSLFNGIAGIGYFLCRLYDSSIPSPLLPVLKQTPLTLWTPNFPVNVDELLYSTAHQLMSKVSANRYPSSDKFPPSPIVTTHDQSLLDSLEWQLTQFEQSIASFSLLEIELDYFSELNWIDSLSSTMVLAINPRIHFLDLDVSLRPLVVPLFAPDVEDVSEVTSVIIKPTSSGFEYTCLLAEHSLIFSYFRTPSSVEDCLSSIYFGNDAKPIVTNLIYSFCERLFLIPKNLANLVKSHLKNENQLINYEN